MRKILSLFAAVLFASSMMALDAYVYGAWDGWATETALVSTDGGVTYSATVEIASAGTYDFAIINFATTEVITRTNNEVVFEGSTGNSKIEIDVPGEYVFTLTLETRNVVVTYPIVTISSMTFEATFPKPGEKAVEHVDIDEPTDAPYWVCGYDVMNADKSANVAHLEVTENTDYNIHVYLCKKPGYVFAVDAAISVDGTPVAAGDKIKNTADEQEFWLPFNSGSATGIEDIVNGQSSNRKFIKDGQLFIERDGKTFNAQGVEVK